MLPDASIDYARTGGTNALSLQFTQSITLNWTSAPNDWETVDLDIKLIPLGDVRPHEEVDPQHAQRVKSEISADGFVKRPLIVSQNCRTLLDGHHRYQALCELKLDFLPCVLVDYDDAKMIEVSAWRENEIINHNAVRYAAVSGALLPPKSSRHRLKVKFGPVRVSLADLKAESLVGQAIYTCEPYGGCHA